MVLFFHATGGSVGMNIKERMKLIPFEACIGSYEYNCGGNCVPDIKISNPDTTVSQPGTEERHL